MTKFTKENADPQLIAQQIMLLDRGLMSGEELRTNLQRTGINYYLIALAI